MTPQDISKMAEERYPVVMSIKDGNGKSEDKNLKAREAWVSGYTAALTSWVKASERLPDKEGAYWCKLNDDLESKNGAYFDGNNFQTYNNQFILEWLSETTLPTVDECMEYAGKEMKKLVWDMIEDWQMSRDKYEDISIEKFSYNDIEIDLYGWLEKIDKQYSAPKSHKQD